MEVEVEMGMDSAMQSQQALKPGSVPPAPYLIPLMTYSSW